MQRRLRTALLVPLVLLVGACTGDGGVLTELPGAFADGVPEPSDEVILTVTTADGDVDWDLATLRQLPQLELTTYEPFMKEDRTFTGPAFVDVLRASGVDVEAPGQIELVALDDYRSSVPTDNARMSGVVVATLDNGEPIMLEDGGPIRLIYPAEHPVGENLNAWIWSMRSGTVQ